MKTIKSRIIVSMVAVVTAALIVLGVISSVANFVSTSNEMEHEFTVLTEVGADLAKWEMVSYKNVAIQMGMDTGLSSDQLTSEQKLETLSNLKTAHGFDDCALLDINGVNLETGISYSERDYFRKALNGESSVTEPMVSKVTGESIFVVAAPVWENGKSGSTVVGCVYVIPDGEYLNNIMRAINLSDSSIAYMIDKNGETIAHTDSNVVINTENIETLSKNDKGLEDLAVIHTKARTGGDGYEKIKIDGVSSIVSYKPVEGTNDWSLIVKADSYDFYSGIYTTIIITVAVLLVGIAASIFIAVIMGNKIGGPIQEISKRLQALVAGDVTTKVKVIESKDEIGILSNCTKQLVHEIGTIIKDIDRVLISMANGDFNVDTTKNERVYVGDFHNIIVSAQEISTKLSDTLYSINIAADQVTSGSDQVSEGAQTLSQGAAEQAGSVEELAATINDITSKIAINSSHCETAQDNTDEAYRIMLEADKKMDSLIKAMANINDSSHHISNIIKTIEDIAFQTNILALNAAVEAARAGQSGKGFAVVADEVRNLAGKSAEAASNTTKLIQESIEAVETGTEIAAEAANQITVGIEQISNVVQMNSATAEESAAASEELSGQAAELKNLTGAFSFQTGEKQPAVDNNFNNKKFIKHSRQEEEPTFDYSNDYDEYQESAY